jgi:peroxiredoxin
MNEFDLMTRAVIIINEQMEVLYVDYADEVTQDVDLLNAFAFLKNL